ncbi:MAG: SDR family NAD(P)-dependent oxidoreductase, partial [Vicingaceae bacterium]
MKVLITGASRGLGFELVKKFASNKNNEIVAVSRNLARLNELKKICEKEFQNFIHIYSIDFLSNNVEHDFVDLFKEHTSHFDIVINNAGFLINQSFSSTSYSNVLDVYKTNVFAPMLLIKSLIPLLNKEKLCHVVNIGSMGGFQGSAKFSGLSIYSSSKAALANLTECLA